MIKSKQAFFVKDDTHRTTPVYLVLLHFDFYFLTSSSFIIGKNMMVAVSHRVLLSLVLRYLKPEDKGTKVRQVDLCRYSVWWNIYSTGLQYISGKQ